ncbi:hypothetical protein Rsub_09019 [Raphidocelis subcapitata]|uniref:SAP domain-containing protein n=1 Tax=Raphidocelis subcapitata TaxID=307507 RepID=A0A2V0PBM8_9CHLO|nr:hypothetical protein Rsub_09019 [Raphidocelis subcapitata]|eukprot:GBF96939.1 hypothetical protein Rsub_09019 [Raphidocelis subcapitata]
MGKRKKPDAEDESVNVFEAKAGYGMTDEDLAGMSPPTDMHLRGFSSPVKGYLRREVEARLKEKARKDEWSRRRAAEIAAKKAEAAREARKRARHALLVARRGREAAKERLQVLGGSKARARDKHGASPLPEEVLAAVLDRLVADLEPGGVWGPGLVAQQLASASMVCWDWYHAAKESFADLADAIDQRLGQVAPANDRLWAFDYRQAAAPWACAPAGLGWGFWDALVSAPAGLKLAQLREAAYAVGVGASGTKPQLILRFLGALGLAAPTPVPACVLRAVALERGEPRTVDGPDRCGELTALLRKLYSAEPEKWPYSILSGSFAATRRKLVAAGVCSIKELRPIVAEARRAAEEKARLDAERKRAEMRRQGRCECGSTYALGCPNKCCRHCCSDDGPGMLPCARHRKPGRGPAPPPAAVPRPLREPQVQAAVPQVAAGAPAGPVAVEQAVAAAAVAAAEMAAAAVVGAFRGG